MKALLVILAYMSNGGQGGIGLDLEVKEFPSMQTCMAVGQSVHELAQATIRWKCVEVPPEGNS